MKIGYYLIPIDRLNFSITFFLYFWSLECCFCYIISINYQQTIRVTCIKISRLCAELVLGDLVFVPVINGVSTPYHVSLVCCHVHVQVLAVFVVRPMLHPQYTCQVVSPFLCVCAQLFCKNKFLYINSHRKHYSRLRIRSRQNWPSVVHSCNGVPWSVLVG